MELWEKTLTSELIFDGKVVHLYKDTVELPGGVTSLREYVKHAPDDVMLMQNFEDAGFAEQLGVERQAIDYWLSYTGPSVMFDVTAEQANKSGKHLFAKMQALPLKYFDAHTHGELMSRYTNDIETVTGFEA